MVFIIVMAPLVYFYFTAPINRAYEKAKEEAARDWGMHYENYKKVYGQLALTAPQLFKVLSDKSVKDAGQWLNDLLPWIAHKEDLCLDCLPSSSPLFLDSDLKERILTGEVSIGELPDSSWVTQLHEFETWSLYQSGPLRRFYLDDFGAQLMAPKLDTETLKAWALIHLKKGKESAPLDIEKLGLLLLSQEELAHLDLALELLGMTGLYERDDLKKLNETSKAILNPLRRISDRGIKEVLSEKYSQKILCVYVSYTAFHAQAMELFYRPLEENFYLKFLPHVLSKSNCRLEWARWASKEPSFFSYRMLSSAPRSDERELTEIADYLESAQGLDRWRIDFGLKHSGKLGLGHYLDD